jgi:hypothetical protein
MHSVYMFSCKHARTYHATAIAICMRRRARVRSVIQTSSSAVNKPAATNCHRRSRRLPFPSPQSLRNKTKPKIYWGSTAATASDQKRMLARSGRGVLARIAVKQMSRDCAQCTFHTPTCLVEACSCRQNHRQSHQQTGGDSRRRCKRRSAVWKRERAYEFYTVATFY